MKEEEYIKRKNHIYDMHKKREITKEQAQELIIKLLCEKRNIKYKDENCITRERVRKKIIILLIACIYILIEIYVLLTIR
ncbi:MAG: hypothetical protein LBC92_00365 [Rickettsiales bacterium]|jgi:hypothetical protein|nr:hypothetical protein [Rickettsiales bacterium]